MFTADPCPGCSESHLLFYQNAVCIYVCILSLVNCCTFNIKLASGDNITSKPWLDDCLLKFTLDMSVHSTILTILWSFFLQWMGLDSCSGDTSPLTMEVLTLLQLSYLPSYSWSTHLHTFEVPTFGQLRYLPSYCEGSNPSTVEVLFLPQLKYLHSYSWGTYLPAVEVPFPPTVEVPTCSGDTCPLTVEVLNLLQLRYLSTYSWGTYPYTVDVLTLVQLRYLPWLYQKMWMTVVPILWKQQPISHQAMFAHSIDHKTTGSTFHWTRPSDQ